MAEAKGFVKARSLRMQRRCDGVPRLKGEEAGRVDG